MKTNNIDLTNYIDKEVEIAGWVFRRRDLGKMIFVDLRDITGIVQVVFLPNNKELLKKAEELRSEWVIKIKGKVSQRPENMVNKDTPLGDIEIAAEDMEILSKSEPLPFEIESENEVSEDIRLKYRYLDLRRPKMAANLTVRHRVINFIRNFLDKKGFFEIETPILTKSTPEGARDFLVPSRLQPGKFYALPQSPQQYKQLLMVAGFERYFQIARCFRDEDPRAHRAYGEFTQLDMEMSFMSQDDILSLTEEMFISLVKEIFPDKKIAQAPWPRISYGEAMKKYKTDSPDLRKDKDNPDELAFAWIVDFPLFKKQEKDDFFFGSGKAEFAPSHHMFTAPHPEDIGLLDKEPLKVRGLQHDLVLNGFEIGGGSVRINNQDIQKKVFDLIGFSEEQKKEFEHMLAAFSYGVPPHGGIAPGVDRFLMILLNEASLREVIAFPMSAMGKTAVMDAPSEVPKEQLKELGIEIKKSKKNK